jgi:hypothetical protein
VTSVAAPCAVRAVPSARMKLLRAIMLRTT